MQEPPRSWALEDSLSSTLGITDRQPVAASDFEEALAELYREHIR